MNFICSTCRGRLKSLFSPCSISVLDVRWSAGQVTSRRHFLGLFSDKRKRYSQQKVFGYPVEQVYSVVYEIGRYKEFLPWCIDSVVTKETGNTLHAKLVVGFPPLRESYTSIVTVKPNKSIQSISHDGWLFEHLENVWEFQPGPTDNSCIIYCGVEFEFRSHLHSQLALLFYEEVVKQMTTAFEKRCIQLYGRSNLPEDATKYTEADMKT